MASINQVVAARVRSVLAERRISNADFAIAVGLSDRTAARRLAGTSSWALDELDATAQYLSVPLSFLTSEREEAAA